MGFAWWLIGMVLAVIYIALTYRFFRGKVRLADDGGYVLPCGQIPQAEFVAQASEDDA